MTRSPLVASGSSGKSVSTRQAYAPIGINKRKQLEVVPAAQEGLGVPAKQVNSCLKKPCSAQASNNPHPYKGSSRPPTLKQLVSVRPPQTAPAPKQKRVRFAVATSGSVQEHVAACSTCTAGGGGAIVKAVATPVVPMSVDGYWYDTASGAFVACAPYRYRGE